MTEDLPPTQYLILEVLAARHRTGEPFWAFPTSVRWALLKLADAGLIEVMSSPEPRTYRAKLTDEGLRASVSLTYSSPHLTLAQGIDTLPVTNDDMFAWTSAHGLGLSAGCGAVINAVRHDLRQLPGGA